MRTLHEIRTEINYTKKLINKLDYLIMKGHNLYKGVNIFVLMNDCIYNERNLQKELETLLYSEFLNNKK